MPLLFKGINGKESSSEVLELSEGLLCVLSSAISTSVNNDLYHPKQLISTYKVMTGYCGNTYSLLHQQPSSGHVHPLSFLANRHHD